MESFILKKIKFIKNNLKFITIILVFIFFINIPISYAQDNNVVNNIGKVVGSYLPFQLSGAVLNAFGLSPDSLALGGLNSILGFFKNFLLFILGQTIIPLLNGVMAYQNFFTNGVNTGWEITRNFTNLFFALVLLLIAISTVLGIGALDNYTAKRMLPQFIFVALFINFSKAIVGFLIDISQIIMITFYNSFGPNLSNIIGNASKLAESGAESAVVDNMSINVFTIIIVAILAFVLLWTALILAIRIVTLWFVIMLSPLAFMSALIPGLKSMNSEWSKNLQESLIVGPTLMFLLYLAFAVMSNGVSIDNVTTGNLMTNGNLLNYVLVIGLLFIANSTASKAAQAAPSMLKNAVGVAGTVATFGLGAYVGAGGYNTNQLRKKTIELGDKGIGGVTRTIQAGSLGNVKLNSRYEAMKKDMVARNDAGKGLFGGLGQQFSKAGQEEQQKDFDKTRANELYTSGKLEDKANDRYKKIFDSNQAAVTSDIKGVENLDKLIEDLDEALKDGDKAMAMALSSRISELKGWSKVFAEDGKFGQYSKYNGSEGEQLTAFITDNFGKDKSGKEIENNKILNDFKSRQVSILRSKGNDNFTVGLTSETMSSPSKKAIDAGILGAGAMFAKNNQIFNVRDYETDTEGNKVYLYDDKGLPSYSLDTSKFLDLIKNETSIDSLKDPKSWAPFGNKNKNDIKESVNKELEKSDIPDDARKKLEASLLGLGKYS